METKTSKAIQEYKQGNFRGSLRLFKSFTIGLSKEDQRVLGIAHEIENGKGSFYIQLGLPVSEIISEANEIIKRYIKSYKKNQNEKRKL
jgi:hypothetical protein